MEEVLIYIIFGGFAFWLGWHIRGIIVLANLATNPDKIIKMLEEIKRINQAEEAGETIDDAEGTEIAPELVGNMWYAYAKDSGEFLGQGSTFDDAIQMATSRFPNKKFWYKNPNELSHNT